VGADGALDAAAFGAAEHGGVEFKGCLAAAALYVGGAGGND